VKDDRKYLLHILECIRRTEEDVAGGRAEFEASHTIQDAVIRNLQVMAESTKRLSDGPEGETVTDRGRASLASGTSWSMITSESISESCGRLSRRMFLD
jgi:ribonuclease HepT-like protein